ncbi:hypothetical protein A8C56_03800 [Niabella ginsenosidivorans]|uniref:Uncharacterized protein n=1 Tax=Niabella ginsenosidivorans TaxID=1176587 RepID=A0A1A9I0G2_9BACT|nr:hypothetical protein A8C56_03800 [Niabella ginsenosidivorans]
MLRQAINDKYLIVLKANNIQDRRLDRVRRTSGEISITDQIPSAHPLKAGLVGMTIKKKLVIRMNLDATLL